MVVVTTLIISHKKIEKVRPDTLTLWRENTGACDVHSTTNHKAGRPVFFKVLIGCLFLRENAQRGKLLTLKQT